MRGRVVAFALVLEAITIYQPVEQQGSGIHGDPNFWVVNPTTCVWDSDDETLYRGNGEMAAGESVQAEHCIIGDHSAHLVSVTMVATSPDLDVRIALSGDGLSFEAVAVPTPLPQKKWRYDVCLYGPDYDASLIGLPVVEGSNGGVGEMWTGAVTITNPTGKRVRDVASSFRVGAEQSQRDCMAERLHFGPSVWRGWTGG